ncbi:DinB family protein [Echinicola sp. CAU 1574]|uniref:DinB family protein n=1 Tax=Echinicola arenosa TaxID=2774144 RepID=A0ABR9ALC1_9BACT|nr:DinB family protein [Echinicola arenosa]MBD8488643.1 DinB family protein [Echinicola arenosa]
MNIQNKDVFSELEEISGRLISLLENTNESDLNRIPFEGSWTAAQVGDHLLKSYGVVETLNGQTKNCNRPPDQKVWNIKKTFLDFSLKMKSPAAILPASGVISKSHLITNLNNKFSSFKLFENQDLTLECKDFTIPEYGAFTRLEWLWFTIFHTCRHTYQLERILASLKAKYAWY